MPNSCYQWYETFLEQGLQRGLWSSDEKWSVMNVRVSILDSGFWMSLQISEASDVLFFNSPVKMFLFSAFPHLSHSSSYHLTRHSSNSVIDAFPKVFWYSKSDNVLSIVINWYANFYSSYIFPKCLWTVSFQTLLLRKQRVINGGLSFWSFW